MAGATAARSGLPIIRPLLLTDPRDPRGWAIADAYGYGPSLWVAPVLEAGAREREVDLPRGDWIDYWTGEELAGGGEVVASAPLGRIPVWVRRGALFSYGPTPETIGRDLSLLAGRMLYEGFQPEGDARLIGPGGSVLTVNTTTALALGVEIPGSVSVDATY